MGTTPRAPKASNHGHMFETVAQQLLALHRVISNYEQPGLSGVGGQDIHRRVYENILPAGRILSGPRARACRRVRIRAYYLGMVDRPTDP